MQSKHIVVIIQVFCLISMITGFVLAGPIQDGCQDPLLTAASDEKKVITTDSGNVTLIDEEIQAQADALADTCPRGFHCSCPGCPLWSDIDEDNFCDHGEEPIELNME
ncbi:hypothetical protein [Methanospirillum sp.]|uniref:hypothetical protein n=1 Tax=Methanospirillum sp. TaxID=45200 RepID=UPI002B6521F7|nr:hypothetical protein [Methanospirillum sp.]HOL41023.1 hypothetical protein [Methanospirillum sp.]HPP77462.1 hypothetical protein [Methanospirillum sp.]